LIVFCSTGTCKVMNPTSVHERFSGPAENRIDPAELYSSQWDSGILDLDSSSSNSSSGNFALELWRFQESWRLRVDAGKAMRGQVGYGAEGESSSVLEREELRASYTGRFKVSELPALKLAGFQRRGLNQAFAEQARWRVNGRPTWWSEDGRYFIYYAREYDHWKVNALRASGGDGPQSVGQGGRRSGRGFAHSGPVGGDTAGDASTALRCAEGWFEVSNGEWQPLEPNVSPACSWSFAFTAATVESDVILTKGQVTRREKHHVGTTAFWGIRNDKSSKGCVLLFLPPMPESSNGDSEIMISEDANMEPEEANRSWCTEDPEVMVLAPALPKAKL